MGEYVARRGSARLPIRAPVTVKYPGVDEVYDETIANIGMAGMFVCADSPMPPGTLMHFELRPAENWRTLRGRGRVVWSRQHASKGQPTGMGVRFVELEDLARRGVRWMIETYQEDEARPFETWRVPERFARSGAGRPAADVLSTQEIPPLEGGDRRRTTPWLAVAAGIVALAMVGWLAFDSGGRSAPRTATPAADATATDATATDAASDAPAAVLPADGATAAERQEARGGEAPPAPTVAEPPTAAVAEPSTVAVAETPTAPVTSDASAADAVADSVADRLTRRARAWAEAWSSQDVVAYLSFYAPDFRPDGGATRETWAAQRRDRLTRPRFIEVEIEDVQVLEADGRRPSTVFRQSYTSDTFSDQVTKSLTWRQVNGRWLIVAERSAP